MNQTSPVPHDGPPIRLTDHQLLIDNIIVVATADGLYDIMVEHGVCTYSIVEITVMDGPTMSRISQSKEKGPEPTTQGLITFRNSVDAKLAMYLL